MADGPGVPEARTLRGGAVVDKNDYERLEAVFSEAAEFEGRLRAEYLDRACAGDDELRHHVELLLRHDLDEDDETIYDRPGMGRELLAGAIAKEEQAGKRARPGLRPETIGRYSIRDRIAEGGMGVVYLAEQDHPRRQVALKVIRPGVFTEELLKRFEFEAELLGRLQHPGIAQIYDAGEAETEVGRQPYYAMEYIEGVPLTEYAASRTLSPADRLRLLARICDAVHHAHQKGIVHRDLKPANILVVEEAADGDITPVSGTGDSIGQPKVLDFGVSRLVQDRRADVDRLTQTGFVVGTVAYMSPEQAGGDRTVDTRSDVYSLGVIGFELLAGRLPHEVRDLPFIQALRTIQEKPAPRLESVNRDLRGDISIIIGKALEADRDQRYSSAAALADDIRRYLTHQPITARPPTLSYQIGRFVRRNKAVVLGATAAILALVVGLVLALVAQSEEARQRHIAEERTAESRGAAYAALIQVAGTLGAAGDVIPARRRLAATPPELRGWEWEYLSRRFEAEIEKWPMAILSRPAPAFSPGGGFALVAVGERTLRVIDLEQGSWTDRTVAFDVRSAALRDDGRTAFVAVDGKGVFRIDIGSGAAPAPFSAVDGDVVGHLESGPDGRVLLAVVYEGGDIDNATVVVLDVETRAVISRFPSGTRISACALSSDASLLAFGDSKGRIRIVELASGRTRHRFEEEGDWIRDLCFSPGGTRLAAVDAARGIQVREVSSGRCLRTFRYHQYAATTLRFGPDEETLVSGHEDGRIRRHRIDTGECVYMTNSPETVPDPGRSILGLALRRDGRVAVGITATGVSVRPAISPLPATVSHTDGTWRFVYDVEFSLDGRHIASSSWDGTVRLWDVATRRPLATLHVSEAVWFCRYSPDGRRLVIGSRSGYGTHRFELWDAVTLTCLRKLDRQSRHISGLYVPASSSVVVGASRELLVLDPETLEIRANHPWDAEIWSLALSPDGNRIAVGLENGEVAILDARTFARRSVWSAHEGRVSALAFSPDGLRLASGGSDATVRIRNLGTADPVLSIVVAESREVFAIRFTPDGRRLLVGSRFPGIHVWDAMTGRELLQLKGHEDYVHGLALSPDHRILVSGSGDGTVRFWDARPLSERIAARDRMEEAETAARSHVEKLLRELGSIEKVLAAIGLEDTAARNVALRMWE